MLDDGLRLRPSLIRKLDETVFLWWFWALRTLVAWTSYLKAVPMSCQELKVAGFGSPFLEWLYLLKKPLQMFRVLLYPPFEFADNPSYGRGSRAGNCLQNKYHKKVSPQTGTFNPTLQTSTPHSPPFCLLRNLILDWNGRHGFPPPQPSQWDLLYLNEA